MFGSVPKPLHPYLVSFRHALVDLPRIHDDALSADIRLGAHLKALNTHAERILRSALG